MNRDCWFSIFGWLELKEILRMTKVDRSLHRWGRQYLDSSRQVIYLRSNQLLDPPTHRILVTKIEEDTLNLEKIAPSTLERVRWLGQAKVISLYVTSMQLTGNRSRSLDEPWQAPTIFLPSYPQLRSLSIEASSTKSMRQITTSYSETQLMPPSLIHVVIGPDTDGLIYLPWNNEQIQQLVSLTLLNLQMKEEQLRKHIQAPQTSFLCLPYSP